MHIQILACLLGPLLLGSCVAHTRIEFSVTAHRAPDLAATQSPATFAVDPAAAVTDSIPAMKVTAIARDALLRHGWTETPVHEAAYHLRVYCSMSSGMEQKTTPRSSWVDSNGWIWSSGGRTYDYEVHVRRILLELVRAADGSLAWSADCISAGSTPDVTYPAPYMLPYAVARFPQEGVWRSSVLVP